METLTNKRIKTMTIRVNVTDKIKLTCPECIKELNLVHLDWYALVCIHCKKEVRKTEFLVKVKDVGIVYEENILDY